MDDKCGVSIYFTHRLLIFFFDNLIHQSINQYSICTIIDQYICIIKIKCTIYTDAEKRAVRKGEKKRERIIYCTYKLGEGIESLNRTTRRKQKGKQTNKFILLSCAAAVATASQQLRTDCGGGGGNFEKVVHLLVFAN